MNALITVIAFGVVTGLQTSLLAIGLVLVYRACRFINFAQGQMGAIASALLAVLVLQLGIPYWIAMAFALIAGGGTGAAIDRLLSWRLFNASRLSLLVATIGISQLALMAVLVWPLKGDPTKLNLHGYPQPFGFRWTIGSLVLDSSQVTTLICAPLIAGSLFLFLTRTRLGRAIRGSASNPDAARLAGVSVRKISMFVWIVAGLVSAFASVLNAPSQPAVGFASAAGLSLLLRGLAAALIAGMADFRIAFAAGIGIGVAEQAVIRWVHTPGADDLAVLLMVVASVVLRGNLLGNLVRARDQLTVEFSEAPIPPRIRNLFIVRRSGPLAWVTLFAIIAVAPALPGMRTQERGVFLLLMISYALAGLGLVVLTGWAGQVSLGQFAFLGIGAFTAAAVARHNLSLPLMLLAAGAVTAAASVAVGLPVVRLRGLFLGVVTFAFAFAAQSWLFRQSWVVHDPGSIARISDPRIFGMGVRTIRGAYLVGVVVLVGTVLALRSLRASAVGRALIAVRDNDQRAASYGMAPAAVKLTGLAIAGFVTGMAGALWGVAQGSWTFSAFDPTMSFVLVSVVVVGGVGSLQGPMLGTMVVFAWPYLVHNANTLIIRSFTSGVLLLLVLLFAPGGLASLVTRAKHWAYRALDRNLPPPFVPDPDARPLDVESVSVNYGGIKALREVSIRLEQGEIVGLIGGNGAGKSTLLNCISGDIRPASGSITVRGQDVSGMAAEYRPFLGLSRTFQDAALFAGLTVRETVMAAMDHRDRTGAVGALVGAPWMTQAERDKRARAGEILQSFGLGDAADVLTSELSTGMRRVCDLAAVVAAGSEVVLLDEPTAGLAQREVEEFAPVLKRVQSEHGCSMLIVEHDMPLMMALCDRIYCLEQGQVVAVGTPTEIRSDHRVVASYLGGQLEAIERSGPGTLAKPNRRSPSKRAAVKAPVRPVAAETNGSRPKRTVKAHPVIAPLQPSPATSKAPNGSGTKTKRSPE